MIGHQHVDFIWLHVDGRQIQWNKALYLLKEIGLLQTAGDGHRFASPNRAEVESQSFLQQQIMEGVKGRWKNPFQHVVQLGKEHKNLST